MIVFLVAITSSKDKSFSAATSKVLVGIQPMLIQVPPYIALLRSTRATFLPAEANLPASVLPALPNPITIKSYVNIYLPPIRISF
ncbi:Uncharacterised protein [Streptococcus pneumoniae]|nr:Uncharacterised protein [Streptococcus pneumoniae]CIV72211.1 Uncharacterised protein [Streptococcus pneumoniae]CKF77413.1 Uncharacterised protein [Streptococcus pneumoniae]COK13461.1 Uncharacterised protein [Streptococcus pneumoniae]